MFCLSLCKPNIMKTMTTDFKFFCFKGLMFVVNTSLQVTELQIQDKKTGVNLVLKIEKITDPKKESDD